MDVLRNRALPNKTEMRKENHFQCEFLPSFLLPLNLYMCINFHIHEHILAQVDRSLTQGNLNEAIMNKKKNEKMGKYKIRRK